MPHGIESGGTVATTGQANMLQEQWEAQLSGVIERTKANLSVLQSKKKQQRHQEDAEETSSWPTSKLSSAWSAPERTVVESKARNTINEDELLERLSSRLGSVSEERVHRLEEDMAELRARASQAVTSARAHESAVESLSRESHSRKSSACKMLAWQSDTEQWRSRVDSTLEVVRARSKHVDNLQRSVSEALSRAASKAELRAAVEEARARSAAAAQAAVSPVHQIVATELDKLKAQVAALGLPQRCEEQSIAMAAEAALSVGMAEAEKRIEAKLSAHLEAFVCAKLAQAEDRSTADSRQRVVAALSGGVPETWPSEAQRCVDRAVASLLTRIDDCVDETRLARDEADRRQEEYELEFRKLERRLEEVRDELLEKVTVATSLADSNRGRLHDEIADSKKRSDIAKAEIYAVIDAKVSEWRDDAGDLRRNLARHDKRAGALEEKIRVIKVSARAYAEDAPAVRRASALAAKFEKIDHKLDAVDAKTQRIRDLEDRIARDRARLERIERASKDDVQKPTQQRQDEAQDSVVRDLTSRLGRLEEWRDAARSALAALTPARLDRLDEAIGSLAKRADDTDADSRQAQSERDLAAADLKESIENQIQTISRAVEDCRETATRAADDAAKATVNQSVGIPSIDFQQIARRLANLEGRGETYLDNVNLVPEGVDLDARRRLDAIDRKLRNNDLSDSRVDRFSENIDTLSRRVDDLSTAVQHCLEDTCRRESPLRCAADLARRRVLGGDDYSNAITKHTAAAPKTSTALDATYAQENDDSNLVAIPVANRKSAPCERQLTIPHGDHPFDSEIRISQPVDNDNSRCDQGTSFCPIAKPDELPSPVSIHSNEDEDEEEEDEDYEDADDEEEDDDEEDEDERKSSKSSVRLSPVLRHLTLAIAA